MHISKIRKLKRFLPKKMQTKRAGYMAMALLIVFSIFVYDIYFHSPKVKAATIGTSSDGSATGSRSQRHVVVTSTGKIVALFNAGTASPTGIVYSVSTDNGATWGSVTQINSVQSDDFSAVIDGQDNIYIAYANNSASIYYQTMTYSSSTGTWSAGGAVTVQSGTGCNSSVGDIYSAPVITVNSDNKIYVNYQDRAYTSGCISITSETSNTFYSTNGGSTWNASLSIAGSASYSSLLAVGKSLWLANNQSLYADVSGSGTFVQTQSLPFPANSISYGLDNIYIFGNQSGVGPAFTTYSITSGTASSVTTISANVNDYAGQVSTDSQNIWLTYQVYVAANSFNIVYKHYNGTAWDASATSITTDNANNTSISMPVRMGGSMNVPVIWTVGTSSPYTIKSATISSIGGVTDTGNQTGSYSGSLTGSSGDVIVKCGTWYYNTVNIVAGMTVKVCPSNGRTGGKLEIYANSVTIAGTVDGDGRGNPGGFSINNAGGLGGTGGGGTTSTDGAAGVSVSGPAGSGSYGAAGGTGGTAATPAGTAGSNSLSAAGGGGGGGNGTAATAGANASAIGGYLGAGNNGDTSTDSSLVMGSGGGAGGAGGPGAGGGGGGYGWNSGGWTNPGGNGGNGAAGGYGGKGGNGGAIVRIHAAGNLTVSGIISLKGQSGGTGGTSGTGSNGQPGTIGCDPTIC